GFAHGLAVPTSDLGGVLTRMPAVFETDLPQITVADRAYVAAEMTAFLLAWLGDLPCPVLNRARPTSLAGPVWRPEEGIQAAAPAGLRVPTICRGVDGYEDLDASRSSSLARFVIVGGTCVGPTNSDLEEQARTLARHVGAELLQVDFAAFGPNVVFQ